MSAASSRSTSIEVRARVSGYLDAIHFQDGQIVRKGDLLFTIDRRPFETALAQAQASLEQAKANLAFAEADLQRAQSVAVGTVITQQTLDQRTQAKRVAQANVAAQEQAVRQAALDLEFTELRAPVDGRIGDRRVSVGNLVTGGTAGTTLLATIESVDPIRFEFTLDEGSYLRYARLAKDKADAADRGLTLPVRLKLIDETSFTHAGRLDFVDNAISRSSGTIRARAVFANPDRTFTPGMFGARADGGGAAGRHAAGAGGRDRRRAGAQVRDGGRCRQRGAAEIRHARARGRRPARGRRNRAATTTSSSTG